MPTNAPKATIRYGNRHIAVNFPDRVSFDVAGRSSGPGNEDEILGHALRHPLDSPDLRTFLAGAKSPLIVVNDHTRSTPTAKILDAIWNDLSSIPNWRIIVATGLHRAPNDGEAGALFGARAVAVAARLLIHNGYDPSQLVAVDSSANQTKVHVNRALLESDRVILINSVEPHFFAGYTGGRKSIIPGLAGFETVQQSHAGAVSENAAPLRVDDNPVRAFIHAHTRWLADRSIWSIQAVLDRADKIAAVYTGHIDKTFEAACEAARKYYVVEIERPYDVVIGAIHPPLDISLYQAMKGWEQPMAGVRDGGVLILTAPCWEGIGARFYARLVDEYPDRNMWAQLEAKPYTLGLHKLVRTARALKRFRLFAVTGMPSDEVRRFGYQPHESLDAALSAAFDYVSLPARVLIVEDSALTTIVRKDDAMHREMARLKTEAECIDI